MLVLVKKKNKENSSAADDVVDNVSEQVEAELSNVTTPVAVTGADR